MALAVANASVQDHIVGDEHLNVLSSDLDLFTERPINASHAAVRYSRLPTLSNLQNQELSIIEFDIAPTSSYIDLRKSMLELRVKLMKKDALTGSLSMPTAADGKLAPANLLLHTLIARVELLLGPTRVNVSPTDTVYGLLTYMSYAINYGSDAKSSHLSQAGWMGDKAGKFDVMDSTNPGFQTRSDMFKDGKEVQLRGYVNTPLMQQSKLLINQCSVRLVLHLKPSKYVLMGTILPAAVGTTPAANHTFVYQITDANLRVCSVHVNPAIQFAHETALSKGLHAKYQIIQPIVTHHTIASGNRQFAYQNLFVGDVPGLMFCVLQSSARFEGSMDKNCLKFEHFNLIRMQVLVNGDPYPCGTLEVDFSSQNFLDAYNTLFTATQTFNRDMGIDISRSDYANGNTIIGWDLTKNAEGACTEIRDPAQQGNVSIELHFKEDLTESVILTVVGYMKTSLQITRERNILKAYR